MIRSARLLTQDSGHVKPGSMSPENTQSRLKSFTGSDIQMIGGLIQKQRISLTEDELGERQATLFSST